MIPSNKIEYLSNIALLDKNKLCVIAIFDAKDRKTIHQYIENNYEINKTSLYSKNFDSCIRFKLIECYYCDYKQVKLSPKDYHYGEMENNQDEYYSTICPKCNEQIIYEPNYDNNNNIKCIKNNNIIILGSYVQFNRPFHATNGVVEFENFEKIINNQSTKIFEIISPTIKYLNKYKLQEYIDEQIINLLK